MNFPFFRKNSQQQPNEESTRGISEAIDHLQSAPPAWNAEMGEEEAVGERILSRLLVSIEEGTNNRGTRVRKMGWWTAAAAVAVLCIIAGFYKNDILDSMYTSPQVLVEAKAAHREKITLPDGSVVVLNAGSRLSYPQQFAHKKREVTLLEGEAFFDIKQDAKRPFTVKSGQLNTTVLGTTFNIRAYRFIPSVTVTVASGKVAVNKQDDQPYILMPDQQVNYARAGGLMEQKTVKAADAIGWMDGRLLFANEDFKQVAGLLENKYNVKIVFDEVKLTAYHFTATFEASETLNDVLDALTLTKGLEYSVKNNIIHIHTAKQ